MPVAPRSGFDRLAPVYDQLASIVFRNKLRESQYWFLPSIPFDAKVVIIGGGTGRIISEIFRAQPSCRIWFIDSSKEMINMAKENCRHQNVVFIQGTHANVPDEKFDIVILPFFLDMFNETTLKKIVLSILPATTVSSRWFITDFVDHGRWWEHILLKVMYWFFRMTCSIEAAQLPVWHVLITDLGFRRLESKLFYGGFIESHCYTQMTQDK